MVGKIGAPGQRELAVVGVVDGDHPEIVVDEQSLRLSGTDRAYVDAEAACAEGNRTPARRYVPRSRRCSAPRRRAWCSPCRWRRQTP